MIEVTGKIHTEDAESTFEKINGLFPELGDKGSFHVLSRAVWVNLIITQAEYSLLQLCIPEVKWNQYDYKPT